MTKKVKWPSGNAAFYKQVKEHSNIILNDTVVAIDPSSGGVSNPGYAVFKNGKLATCGEIIINGRLPAHIRLQQIYEELYERVPYPDLMLIERLRGRMAPVQLQWSVGVAMVAAPAPICIEVPICMWKAYVRDIATDHVKSNADDAKVIGESVLMLAKEL